VFSKALTVHVARLANHCFCGICLADHVYRILLPVVVCQRKSALKTSNFALN
jgi:hypothetical protein